MKKNKKKKIMGALLSTFIVLVLIVGIGAFGAFSFYRSSLKPVSEESEEVEYSVRNGCYAKCVLQELEEEGVVRNATMAYIYARQSDLTEVKKGDYILNKNMSVDELLRILTDPTAAIQEQVEVTIVEGKWAEEIAEQLESELNNVTASELLALWNDTDYVESLLEEYGFLTEDVLNADLRCKLEGYLFPETYYFNPNSDAKTVTKRLLNQTEKIYEKHAAEFEKSPFSIHEVFTLASIVQYESGKSEDDPGIAQVFINRLNNPTFDGIGGYLQSNVTAQYAWGSRDVNPEIDANKTIKSPFNTYAYPGLPIGPVCNPGESSINAVLNPDTACSDYYYFLADTSGNIHYAANYSEHLRNIQTYR